MEVKVNDAGTGLGADVGVGVGVAASVGSLVDVGARGGVDWAGRAGSDVGTAVGTVVGIGRDSAQKAYTTRGPSMVIVIGLAVLSSTPGISPSHRLKPNLQTAVASTEDP